jgi:hypothetical protein
MDIIGNSDNFLDNVQCFGQQEQINGWTEFEVVNRIQ